MFIIIYNYMFVCIVCCTFVYVEFECACAVHVLCVVYTCVWAYCTLYNVSCMITVQVYIIYNHFIFINMFYNLI